MEVKNVLKYVKKVLVRNTVTGSSSFIDIVELKQDTKQNRKKLEVAGIEYEVKELR